MSKRVIPIPQIKEIGSVWEQQLRVAAYCRVSTDSEEQQCSLKNQIEYYSNYIQRQTNWTLVSVYSDTASGIQTKKRDGYQQMLKDCRKGKIDLIIVKSLSRFGRDTQRNDRTDTEVEENEHRRLCENRRVQHIGNQRQSD